MMGIGVSLALAGCEAEPAPDDDDDAVVDDDDAVSCGQSSGGSGGSVGTSWYEIDGFGTPGDGVPDYELLVHVPEGLDPAVPAPVLMLVARRMPLDRPTNEMIMLETNGVALRDFLEDQGWIGVLPLPGIGPDGISWQSSATDDAFLPAAHELLADNFDIDLDRFWMVGSSAGGAAGNYLSWRHGGLVAAQLNHAGPNPFAGSWPETPWDDDCAALFVHGPTDNVVSEASVEDGALMWEDAGQRTERDYEYEHGHEWNHAAMNALMADFFPTTCN